MNEEFIIVSALFNIKREGMDGRKWDQYLEWLDKTLKLKCHMIMFVSEDVAPFIRERRPDINIQVQDTDEIPYWNLKPRLDEIISRPEYKTIIKDPERIECQHSEYSIIQYSKFEWLIQAMTIESNFKYFFWLDAGGSRFFENYDLNLEYPSPEAIKSLEDMGDSFLVQMNMEYYRDLAGAKKLDVEYLKDNRSFILGSMFGGTQKAIRDVSKRIQNIVKYDMMEKNFINNEQIALGYLVKDSPELFSTYERYNGKHMDLFTEALVNDENYISWTWNYAYSPKGVGCS